MADYLMRLINQIAAAIAGIIAKRSKGEIAEAVEEIERTCLEQVGLPLIVFKQSTPDAVAELLANAGALRVPRSLLLAELLVQDALIAESVGNPVAAALGYTHAERLLRDSLPSLGPDDEKACLEKLDMIAAKRRDLG